MQLVGTYFLYSGEQGEKGLPTAKDFKVMFSIKGQLAKDLYAHLPRGKPYDCSEGVVIRRRGHLECYREIRNGNIECSYGLDTRTGKSVNDMIC